MSFHELQDEVKRLTEELAETKEQRDRIAKDFDRLKTIVDAGYRESADTTCCCEKKRNDASANEDPVVESLWKFLREFWRANR
jgi:predicted nuclease with TOPRIM domain